MNLIVALALAVGVFLIFRRRALYEQELAIQAGAKVLVAECEAVLRRAATP